MKSNNTRRKGVTQASVSATLWTQEADQLHPHWDSRVLVGRGSRCFSLAPDPLLPIVFNPKAGNTPIWGGKVMVGEFLRGHPKGDAAVMWSQPGLGGVGRKETMLVANTADLQLLFPFSWT